MSRVLYPRALIDSICGITGLRDLRMVGDPSAVYIGAELDTQRWRVGGLTAVLGEPLPAPAGNTDAVLVLRLVFHLLVMGGTALCV